MLKRLLPLRAVLVTGKGGVGKTTVAASLARYAAQAGKRVLVAEIGTEDTTSSALADVLGLPALAGEPIEVAPNLHAVALQPSLGHQRFLRDVLPMKFLADAAMKTGAIRRFLSAAPTFPEMGVLYRLLDLRLPFPNFALSDEHVVVTDADQYIRLSPLIERLARHLPTEVGV